MDCSTQAFLSFTSSWSLPRLTSFESGMPSNLLTFCHRLLLPSVFPSIRVFSDQSALCIRWPKYWSFSFSISTSKEYSGLISFRIDWLDLLAVQGTLESLLQHHSSKVLILWCSAFFIVQLSHPYMTTGKTVALTRWSFVSKVMSLCFNIPSWFVIAFLPRSKLLSISWLTKYGPLKKGTAAQHSCRENPMNSNEDAASLVWFICFLCLFPFHLHENPST